MTSLSAPILKKVYHSPQSPGYSSWCGADFSPAGVLHVGFVEVTGNPVINPKVSDSVWKNVTIKRKILRSSDHGGTWAEAFRVADSFGKPHSWSMQAMAFNSAGVLLTRVNNEDLAPFFNTQRPPTAYLQRLASGVFAFYAYPGAPAKKIVQVTRLQRLRTLLNGVHVLLASGNQWMVPAGASRAGIPNDWFLAISLDNGKTWSDALTNPQQKTAPANEWAVCELANGDLLAVMRTRVSGVDVCRQAILTRNANGTYTFGAIQAAPFPHSGHPELVSPDQGKTVVHLASTGVHLTKDAGKTWAVQPGKTNYYPRAVVDGNVIRAFSHVGADDDYRERDQSIVMSSWTFNP